MNYKEITTAIKRKRKQQDKTLEDVAGLTGYHKQSISLVENGQNTRVDKLIKICNALNMEVIVKEKD